jgi:hypothetical protein
MGDKKEKLKDDTNLLRFPVAGLFPELPKTEDFSPAPYFPSPDTLRYRVWAEFLKITILPA